jgi:isopentenyl diphosphate isomerase/L-lactate dehydrogenase-like FMN-dependent dehydrogenase
MTTIANVREFEALARARLSRAAYAYYSGGSWDELTLRNDEAAFARRRLLPRVLIDGSAVDLSTTLLGQRVAIPIGFAPAAVQGLAHGDGEVTPARVAARAGLLYCLSTFSNRSLEDVAAVGPGLRWFQLDVQAERGRSEEMVHRAAAAGYRALILTVDSASSGDRERELPDPILDGGFVPNIGRRDAHPGPIAQLLDSSLHWDDLAWLGGLSDLPLVVKGIIDPADAVLAVEHGAAAVWVSNYGGRQLDRSPAGIDALERVVDAVAGRAEVYLDGGIRRGTDVVTALALGARAVFIGRPYQYALAAGGEAGVTRCVEILEAELRIAMILLGAPTLAAVTPDRIVR